VVVNNKKTKDLLIFFLKLFVLLGGSYAIMELVDFLVSDKEVVSSVKKMIMASVVLLFLNLFGKFAKSFKDKSN
jgi:hypothetical protein